MWILREQTLQWNYIFTIYNYLLYCVYLGNIFLGNISKCFYVHFIVFRLFYMIRTIRNLLISILFITEQYNLSFQLARKSRNTQISLYSYKLLNTLKKLHFDWNRYDFTIFRRFSSICDFIMSVTKKNYSILLYMTFFYKYHIKIFI